MNYSDLRQELLRELRGKRSNQQVSEKMGFSFNQFYRWESGRTLMPWTEFVRFCSVFHIKLQPALQTCYSYFDAPSDSRTLVKHFTASKKITEVSKNLGVSRYVLGRWIKGTHCPTLDQVLALMDFGSIDFLRFMETLAAGKNLASVRERIQMEKKQLELFFEFPWTSAVLSAIDLAEYKKNPSDAFIAKKAKLSLGTVKRTLEALSEGESIVWRNGRWESVQHAISLRGSPEGRKKIARYVFGRTLDGVESSFGSPAMRFSWKLFSLNKKSYEKILQKYTEFFNELGTLIDEGQEGADSIYLFSVGILDYDHLPESK